MIEPLLLQDGDASGDVAGANTTMLQSRERRMCQSSMFPVRFFDRKKRLVVVSMQLKLFIDELDRNGVKPLGYCSAPAQIHASMSEMRKAQLVERISQKRHHLRKFPVPW